MLNLQNKHVLVMGLGESGLAMAQWCVRQGARVRAADSRSSPPGAAQLADVANVEVVCGPFSPALLEGIELTALSPGLAMYEPVVMQGMRQGIPVVGEIELFAQGLQAIGWRDRCKIIALTGTNGKTTTTSMAGAICRAAGLDTEVAGNISPAALTVLIRRLEQNKCPDVWVLELSSFQLETTQSLQPQAAAVLNVSDDHLDRYDDLNDYAQAKMRIFLGAETQVLNQADSLVMAMRDSRIPQRLFSIETPEDDTCYGVRIVEGKPWLARGVTPLLEIESMQVAGLHNVENALAAAAMCQAIGVSDEHVAKALQSFKGLPHRVEKVGHIKGVDVYDDSKGTNVGATVAALNGLRRQVVLIAGGDGKGQDFTPLLEPVARYARYVALIGRDAELIESVIKDCRVPLEKFDTLEAATRAAFARARAGDAILLSPACASLDMFKNYAHRAEVFVAEMRVIAAEQGVEL